MIEVHALKLTGRDLDISKQANRGIYEAPAWIQKVKLQRNDKGKMSLAFPAGQSLKSLLAEMEYVPEIAPLASEAPALESVEEVLEETLLAEEGQPAVPAAAVVVEPPPTMDPATPAFKRAALVKDDAEKPKFDFMSNRPVPRKVQPAEPTPVAPVAEVVETVQEVVVEGQPVVVETAQEVIVEQPVAAAPAFDIDAAFATSSKTLNELRKAVYGRSNKKTSPDVAKASKPSTPVKWQQIPLTDISLKFAVSHPPPPTDPRTNAPQLSKRLTQLTGHSISDPYLTSATDIGDLYHHICDAAKPKPADLYSYLHTMGTRQNRAINVASRRHAEGSVIKMRAPVTGELLKATNVQILRRKPTKEDRRVQVGLNKVVRREMVSKGLLPDPEKQRTMRGLQRPGEAQRKRELARMAGLFTEFHGQDEKTYGLRKRNMGRA